VAIQSCRCGYESNDDQDRFCPRCGEKLRAQVEIAPSGPKSGRYEREGGADVLVCPYCEHANPYAWPEEMTACGSCGRRFRAPASTAAGQSAGTSASPSARIPVWLIVAGVGVIVLVLACVVSLTR
jgi:hypothetical protein